jgi:hypothetical protein
VHGQLSKAGVDRICDNSSRGFGGDITAGMFSTQNATSGLMYSMSIISHVAVVYARWLARERSIGIASTTTHRCLPTSHRNLPTVSNQAKSVPDNNSSSVTQMQPLFATRGSTDIPRLLMGPFSQETFAPVLASWTRLRFAAWRKRPLRATCLRQDGRAPEARRPRIFPGS